MFEFDPRSVNKRYLTRETSGQFHFVRTDTMDTFAHQCSGWGYGTAAEGRQDHGFGLGRTSTAFHMNFRDEDGIRKIDQPDDYYRDPRKLT